MKKKKENRFTYSSDSGLKLVSEEKKESTKKDSKEEPKKEIKKGYERWL